MAHTSEIKGLIIPHNGDGFRCMKDISGDKINEAVGGYFDILAKPNITLWVLDDGMHLPLNYPVALLFGERLFGDVVVTGGVGEQGESLPIPPALIRIVSKFIHPDVKDADEFPSLRRYA
jgi:hypothetical protein